MGSEIGRSRLRDKGQLTLPADVREALHIEAGDEIEFQVLDDSSVILRGLKMIPADQAWFWTESWQAGEAQATREIREGRFETFKDAESFLNALDDE